MKTVSKLCLAALISTQCAIAIAAENQAETPTATEAVAQETVVVSEASASAVVATEEAAK